MSNGETPDFSPESSRPNKLENKNQRKNLNSVLSGVDEKSQIEEKIKKTNSALTRIRIVAMILDKFGADAILGFIPILGDHGPAILAGLYFLIEAKKVGLEKKDILKLMTLQGFDDLIGSIPLAGNAADFVFQSNKASEKIFQNHLKNLQAEKNKISSTENTKNSTTKVAIKEFLKRKIF